VGTLVLLAALGFGAVQVVRCAGDGGGSVTTAGETVTVYATRETRVRPEASGTGNEPLGLVERGDRLRGSWTTGLDGRSRWLSVSEGRHEGAYVWGANLTGAAPPRLAEVVDAEWTIRTAGQVLDAPKRGAAVLGDVAAGRKLRVTGRVNDDWVEIARNGGGVAYADATLFETPSGKTAAHGEEQT
jgi:hypothetical protein